MRIVYEANVAKLLSRHPQRGKLRSKIEQLAADPASLANNIRPLVGRNVSRLHVGDLRIVFRIDGNVLTIREIGPRGGIYD